MTITMLVFIAIMLVMALVYSLCQSAGRTTPKPYRSIYCIAYSWYDTSGWDGDGWYTGFHASRTYDAHAAFLRRLREDGRTIDIRDMRVVRVPLNVPNDDLTLFRYCDEYVTALVG